MARDHENQLHQGPTYAEDMPLRTLSRMSAGVLLAIGAMLSVSALWDAYAAGATPTYLCAVEHPPKGIELPISKYNEGSLIEGRRTVWPMGRECTWHSTVTDETLTYQVSGWEPTWRMTGGMLTMGFGTFTGLASRRTATDTPSS